MKKILLFLFVFPLVFASCSSDDEKGGSEFSTIALKGEATSHDKIQLEWSKVEGAYGYQVYYKAEGASEWDMANFVMATIDQATTVSWNGDFASFSPGTKYTLQVKAFRDSRDGSIIGESNLIEATTLTKDESLIANKWLLNSVNTVTVETNDENLTAFIENTFEEINKLCQTPSNQQFVEFNKDGTFVVTEESDSEYVDKGTYIVKGDVLTMTYTGSKDVVVYKVNAYISSLTLIRDFSSEDSKFILDSYKKESGSTDASISKLSVKYFYYKSVE